MPATHVQEEEHHPSASLYAKVATVLFTLTIFEVAVYYIEPLRALDLLAPILLVLSALKFCGIGGGQIGPNQQHFSERPTIAGGVLPNTPEAVQRWIKNPQGIKPGTLMPDLSVTDEQARHLTAFLYSLP